MNDNNTRWRTVTIVPAAPGHMVEDAKTLVRYPVVGYALQRRSCGMTERLTCLVLCPEGRLVPVDDFDEPRLVPEAG